MLKYLVIPLSLLLISACSLMPSKSSDTSSPNEENTQTPVTTSPTIVGENSLAYVDYTLHETTADGKVIDTSRESDAQKNGLAQTGRTYEPFQVLMSGNNTIPGFRNGLMGMKKGEKKIFEVLPKDGYGDATEVVTLPDYQVKPVFTKVLDKMIFSDVLSQTVDRAMLGEEGKTITVGAYLSGATDTKVKVTKIEGDSITLEMANPNHPFYGKKLAVGLKAEKEDAIFTIKAIAGTGITVEVINKNSPFYNAKVEVGSTAEVKTPFQVMNMEGRPVVLSGNISIVSMTGETITVSIPNAHPLAGKTLYFDVEVVDIK